jgi:hypothetical protein
MLIIGFLGFIAVFVFCYSVPVKMPNFTLYSFVETMNEMKDFAEKFNRKK